MSLRKISFLVLALFAFAGYGTVWLYAKFILTSGTDLHSYAYVQANVFVTVLLIIIATVFFMVIRSIDIPIQKLTKAIQAFAQKNEHIDVSVSSTTPYAVRELIVSFRGLVERVDAAHKRDADVSRIKSDFISTAAHQLRTPLTGIRWALEALQQETLTDDQKMLVTSAAEKSHELVAVVGTLLDISSIESGKHKYNFAPTDISSVLAKVTDGFQYLSKERKVTLHYTPSEQKLPLVRADQERIKWILNNLIENALRYTPAGGGVEVWAEPMGETNVIVRVRDTGIGISQTDRGNIFERFYRAGNAIAKENAGNGLGLYIARTIARDHGGDLNFSENEQGIGTTFTLSLLVAK